MSSKNRLNCVVTRVADLHWADCEDVDNAVESAANGLQAWRAFSKVSGSGSR